MVRPFQSISYAVVGVHYCKSVWITRFCSHTHNQTNLIFIANFAVWSFFFHIISSNSLSSSLCVLWAMHQCTFQRMRMRIRLYICFCIHQFLYKWSIIHPVSFSLYVCECMRVCVYLCAWKCSAYCKSCFVWVDLVWIIAVAHANP